MNVKIEINQDLTVHHLHKGMQSIHRDYGLWICSVGGCSSQSTSKLPTRYFEFYSISHMYEGSGQYIDSQGKMTPMVPGQAVLVSPGSIHSYGAWKKAYVEDSICFYGPIADAMLKNHIIHDGVWEMGKARRLLPIITQASDPAIDSQLNANIALQRLLMTLYHENRSLTKPEKYSRVKSLLELLKDDQERWWTIEEMAEYCNLSTAQFRRVFKKHTGILPKNYIDRLKLNQAAEALTNSNTSIEEVAIRFGYQDPFHFSKRFKQVTGFSPSRYREEFLINQR